MEKDTLVVDLVEKDVSSKSVEQVSLLELKPETIAQKERCSC